jgi:hypothetical protein
MGQSAHDHARIIDAPVRLSKFPAGIRRQCTTIAGQAADRRFNKSRNLDFGIFLLWYLLMLAGLMTRSETISLAVMA